jgi:hypothetical protein
VWIREQDETLLFSVQDVESGETRAFANLEHLNEWLRRETSGSLGSGEIPNRRSI